MPLEKNKTGGKVISKNLLSSAIGEEVSGVSANDLSVKEKHPNDDAWKEVNDVHIQCTVLLSTCTEVRHLLGNKELSSKLNDPITIGKVASIFLRDLTDYANKLSAIKSSYSQLPKDKIDEWDVFSIVGVSEKYFEWMSSFQSVVLPQLVQIKTAYLEGTEEINGG